MRYGIFSDIHSNLEAFNAAVLAYKKESIDKYLCVGDVVGYGANPGECIGELEALAALTVAGNHDQASADLFPTDYFNSYAKIAVLWTRERLLDKDKSFLISLQLTYRNEDLTLVHGTLDNPQDFDYMNNSYAASRTFALLDTDVCFVGHSHKTEIFIQDSRKQVEYSVSEHIDIKPGNRYIVNTGSVGQPRDGDPRAAYCIYDTEKKEIQIKRMNYDIEAARKKIVASGLPQFLGDRLLVGR